MDRARDAGRRLAERHLASAAEPDPAGSLVHYAESPRAGDWTLRSALVRLAQPEPQLVSDLLQRVRRLDAVLHHVAKPLEQRTVICDRALGIATVDDDPTQPYPDTRTADLARLVADAGPDGDVVVDAYLTEIELGPEERGAFPLLGVALRFDTLAEELVTWAHDAPRAAPPLESVRSTITETQRLLDELGVPVETGGPPRGGRRRS